MFPYIDVFWYFQMYMFGLTMVICFFLFFWMLKKLSMSFWYEYTFITDNILWYFMSTFFFSSLFYMISKWKDMQNMSNPFDFFMMSDYYFSLFWAMFWFLFVLSFNVSLFSKNMNSYIDGVVMSFLFVSMIGYIWSFFWGQVYWKMTSLGIEMPYTNSASVVPLTWELFPLPMVYSMLMYMMFSMLYMLSIYMKVSWMLWYVGLGVFSATMLWLDFFSWKTDMFNTSYNLNISQIWAIMLMMFSFYWLFSMIVKWKKQEMTMLWKENES